MDWIRGDAEPRALAKDLATPVSGSAYDWKNGVVQSILRSQPCGKRLHYKWAKWVNSPQSEENLALT